jgi:heme-degrading monooxygenase HmoA
VHTIHVELHVKPDRIDEFELWKTLEGEHQMQHPGFIKRALWRDTKVPTIYYYVSYWESEEAMMDFVRHGFEEAKKRLANATTSSDGNANVYMNDVRVVTEIFNHAKVPNPAMAV